MKLKVLKLIQDGNFAPAQWYGELSDGRSLYIRYRHGGFSIEANDEESLLYLKTDINGGSLMSTEEMKLLTYDIFEWEESEEELLKNIPNGEYILETRKANNISNREG